jgi:hypothetical protein
MQEIKDYCSANGIKGVSEDKSLNQLKVHFNLLSKLNILGSWGIIPLERFPVRKELNVSDVWSFFCTNRDLSNFKSAMLDDKVRGKWSPKLIRRIICSLRAQRTKNDRLKPKDIKCKGQPEFILRELHLELELQAPTLESTLGNPT